MAPLRLLLCTEKGGDQTVRGHTKYAREWCKSLAFRVDVFRRLSRKRLTIGNIQACIFEKHSKRSFHRHIGCSILNLFLHLPISKVNDKSIYTDRVFLPTFFPVVITTKIVSKRKHSIGYNSFRRQNKS